MTGHILGYIVVTVGWLFILGASYIEWAKIQAEHRAAEMRARAAKR